MTTKILAAVGFIATILAANYVTTQYGMVPVGFGLMATAGTYLAGLAFVLRDVVHDSLDSLSDTVGRSLRRRGIRWSSGRMEDDILFAAMVALIALGAGLSFVVSAPSIAVASALAFGLSELADFMVYGPLRDRGYIRAAVASNFVGATVDTVLFLTIAGFPLQRAFWGQILGKMAVTGVALVAVTVVRYTRRPVTA